MLVSLANISNCKPFFFVLHVVFSSPLNLQGTPLTSTSITVRWPALLSTAVTLKTSNLTGYILFYKQSSEDNYKKFGIASGAANLEKILDELKKYTLYRLVVCPYSEKGNGIPSPPVTVRTLEDGKQSLTQ